MTNTSNPTGGIASTRDTQTGPGSTTAGPHSHDLLNKIDPRVDSDLNNRAQYAPGLTASGNVHPGTTQNVSSSDSASSNDGPHDSWLMNKLDPRVDSTTGNMTEKTTNRSGTGSARAPTDTSGTGVGGQTTGITTATAAPTNPNTTTRYTETYPDAGYVGGYVGRSGTGGTAPQGSSTGAAGMYNRQDSRNTYDPRTTRYNSSTGSGYPTAGATSDDRDAETYARGGSGGGNYKQGQQMGAGTGISSGTQSQSKTGQAGEKASFGVNRAASGIHGAGETIRGGVMSTVDRILGSGEGAERNDKIAREGEDEIRNNRTGR